MAKRSFRKIHSPGPDYPVLVEVERSSLRSWGLVGLSSVLLGGAGCVHTQSASSPHATVGQTQDAATEDDVGTLEPPISDGIAPPQRVK
jgi:hypothetical protein